VVLVRELLEDVPIGPTALADGVLQDGVPVSEDGRATTKDLSRFSSRLRRNSAEDLYGDKSVSAMLNDIQTVSRRLLDQEIIDAIGRARASTIDRFGVDVPTDEEFRNAARPNLKQEFAGVGRRDMTPAGSGPGPSAAP
jgi:hypothetical protein